VWLMAPKQERPLKIITYLYLHKCQPRKPVVLAQGFICIMHCGRTSYTYKYLGISRVRSASFIFNYEILLSLMQWLMMHFIGGQTLQKDRYGN
jgi:hypothetical protein